MIVAMTATFHSLEIIGLRGLDGAETRTSAHNVQYQCGQRCRRYIGDTLLLEADARRGGGGHHCFSAGSTAINHVDGRHLGFCLEHYHAGGLPWHQLLEGFEHL